MFPIDVIDNPSDMNQLFLLYSNNHNKITRIINFITNKHQLAYSKNCIEQTQQRQDSAKPRNQKQRTESWKQRHNFEQQKKMKTKKFGGQGRRVVPREGSTRRRACCSKLGMGLMAPEAVAGECLGFSGGAGHTPGPKQSEEEVGVGYSQPSKPQQWGVCAF